MDRRSRAVLGVLLAALSLSVATPAHAGDAPAPRPSRLAAPAETVDVTGKWQGERTAIIQTVTFRADGTMSGNAGCNDFSGTYKVKSWFITIGPLATTLKFCDDATMIAEHAFLTKLQSATRASRFCTTLYLDVSGGFMQLERFVPPGQPAIACSASGNARPF